LSESLKYCYLRILITFSIKSAKIKSQIDVDLFTYIRLSKITHFTLSQPTRLRSLCLWTRIIAPNFLLVKGFLRIYRKNGDFFLLLTLYMPFSSPHALFFDLTSFLYVSCWQGFIW